MTRGFVRVSRPTRGRDQTGIVRVAGGLIGGDYTGAARGRGAVDVQGERADPSNVASGEAAVAFGRNVTASGAGAIALGSECEATGEMTTAIGLRARAHCDRTTNLSGPLITQRGNPAGGDWFAEYAAAEITIFSDVVDLTVVGTYEYALPSGCHVYIDAVGIVCTEWDAVTTQPTVRWGYVGNPDFQKSATTTALTNGYKRQEYAALHPESAHPTLSIGVSSRAIGAAMRGRFYIKGMLVEDEE